MDVIRAEQFTEHGDGPVWDARSARLLMVDMLRGYVMVLPTTPGSENSGLGRHHVGHVLAAIHACRRGKYVDSIALDVDDGVWVALWRGGAVHHYDADGVLLDRVELPVENVTSCACGGEDGSRLFVTTSSVARADGATDAEAGAVFVIETGTRGAIVHDNRG